MTNEEFIAECNKYGGQKKRKTPQFDNLAKNMGVYGFTEKGLAFLASLLSDQFTASGSLNDNGVEPDSSKVWSMPFLSRFNPDGFPQGEIEGQRIFLKKFAQQITAGKKQFEPEIQEDIEQKHKSAKIPNQEYINRIIEKLRNDNGGRSDAELILEEIEDDYDENGMSPPNNWEDITRKNIKNWFNIV